MGGSATSSPSFEVVAEYDGWTAPAVHPHFGDNSLAMKPCRSVGCTREATATIESIGVNGLIKGIADVCDACKESFMAGWQKMQAEANALKDQGLPKKELERIMCARVERGDYKV